MVNGQSSYEKFLDAFVHAPIGLALYTRDTAPGFARLFVARGREELERQRKQVDTQVTRARTMGRLAVAYGPPIMRQRVERHLDRARDVAGSLFAGLVSDATPSPPARTHDRTAPATTVDPMEDARSRRTQAPTAHATATSTSSAAGLPIPDYDELSASQVVERLHGLASVDLDAIAAYEAAHRGRRTILGKIEQLTA